MNRLAEQLMGGDHEVKVARALAWLRTLLWWLKNLPQQAHIFVHEMCVDFLMLFGVSCGYDRDKFGVSCVLQETPNGSISLKCDYV